MKLAIFILSKFDSVKFNSAEKTLERYKLLAEKSPPDALQTLRKDSAHVPEINAMCHKISHEIGRISMKQAKNFQRGYFSTGFVLQLWLLTWSNRGISLAPNHNHRYASKDLPC